MNGADGRRRVAAAWAWTVATGRRARTSDHGFTLVEALVSMAVFSLVIAMAYTALLSVQRQTSDTIARAESVAETRLGIAQMDRQIRSGNVLYDPADEALLGFPMSMRVFTQANAENKCVQWQVLNGDLRMRSWSPTPKPYGPVARWTTVARGVVNKAGDSGDAPFRLGGVANPYSPRVVQVRLKVRSSGDRGLPVDITTSLTGRNTVYGYDTSVCSPIPPA